jgi:hypothetical protein
VTGPIIAQEIVRSVAGTLGLIAAVPITTALSTLTLTRHPSPGSGSLDPDLAKHTASRYAHSHALSSPTGAGPDPVQPDRTYQQPDPRADQPEWPPQGWPRTSADPFT